MEFTFSHFLSQSFVLVCFFTFICCFIWLLAFRFYPRCPKWTPSDGYSSSASVATDTCEPYTKNRKNNCNCDCSRKGVVLGFPSDAQSNGSAGGMYEREQALVVAERQTGASMMEQLVPEIRTHALSYLDYPSLCRLSMTNSLMRKAANDDNAWKALYQKDFTREQRSVQPANGWKAYYAATRAIVNINADFFDIIRDRSLPVMGHFWLNADYVKCIHASGEQFFGYRSVMESWQIAFSFEQPGAFQIRDVRARVLSDMAWVTMKAYVEMEAVPYNVTNVFEIHEGRWYIVHHHCSLILDGGGLNQQVVHA